MVSFQTPFLQLNNQRKTILDANTSSKKRKWDHDGTDVHDQIDPSYKPWKSPKATAATPAVAAEKSNSDVELHLETPLPSEWQRCLDIQSGEIHFYNIKTQKRTLEDPRERTKQPSRPRDCHMSLDLELNLPCGSPNLNTLYNNSEESTPVMNKSSNSPPAESTNFFKSLSSTVETKRPHGFYSENDDQAAEMVAAACMRCHMLVMLQKSSPTCPNCKFVHPPYQSTPDLFKPKLSLSC